MYGTCVCARAQIQWAWPAVTQNWQFLRLVAVVVSRRVHVLFAMTRVILDWFHCLNVPSRNHPSDRVQRSTLDSRSDGRSWSPADRGKRGVIDSTCNDCPDAGLLWSVHERCATMLRCGRYSDGEVLFVTWRAWSSRWESAKYSFMYVLPS